MNATLVPGSSAPGTIPACPEWCDGSCVEFRDEQSGSTSHGGPIARMTVESLDRPAVEVGVTASRVDLADAAGVPEVHLLVGGLLGEDLILSPEQSRRLAAMLINAADTADRAPVVRDVKDDIAGRAGGCPDWCGRGCRPDPEGSSFHWRDRQVAGSDVRVGLSRLDEDGQPGETTVDVVLDRDACELNPAQALAMAEMLRVQALTAAGAAGVDMPVEHLRPGDEVLSPDGWQAVDLVDVDGWCCGVPPEPDHAHLVRVATDAHEIDEQAWEYDAGTLVQVRRAVP